MATKPHTISTSVDDGTKDSVDAVYNDETPTCNDQYQSQPITSVEVSEDETDSKGSLNESHSALDVTTRNFRNDFFQLVEELKLRRILDNENEKQIKILFSEKSQMHQKWEEEVSKYNVQRNRYEKEMNDITKQFEERLHQHEIDKAKDDLAVQCNMKEMNQHKDEIRALHLAKYSIEKRASELDRELQIQATARDHHVKQLAEIEKKYHESVSQAHQVFDLVNRVEVNVGTAARLHKKLSYYNEHQKCQLNSHKQGLESKQQELASLKILVENLKASLRTSEDNERVSEENEKKMRMQAELCRQLQSRLNEARKENKNLIDSLKEAHNLVDQHVGIANKHCELESLAQFELDEVKSEIEKLRKEMGELRKSHETLQHEQAEKLKAWKTEKEEKDKELVDFKSRYEALTHAHNTLEDNNYKLGQQIEEMKNEMEKIRCSEKEKTEALADFSLQIEKTKQDYQNQMHVLQKQLGATRLQVFEESNSVNYWKEKLTATERMEEKLEANLAELNNTIKHKEANRHSRVTQTAVLGNEEDTANIEGLKPGLLKKKHMMNSSTDGRENVKLQMPSVESVQDSSSKAGNTKSNGVNLDDKRVGKVVGVTKEVICSSTPVPANDSITVDSGNYEESIMESREDSGRGTVNTIEFTVSAQAETTKTNMSTDYVSEMDKTNPAFLTTRTLSKSFVEDAKDKLSEETVKDIKCSNIVQGEPTFSMLPLVNNREATVEEEKMESQKTSPSIISSVVTNTHPSKSSLRDKRSSSQGINPARVYKKLRFNLSMNDSQVNVLPSSDEEQLLESEGSEAFLQMGVENAVGYTELTNLTDIYMNVSKVRKAVSKEEESRRGEIEEQMEPSLTHMMSSSNGTNLPVQSCDKNLKKGNGCNENKICSKSGCDYQELFSEDEDEGHTIVMCQDVLGQQIKRIQQFLNNEQLTTSRKRKFPEIHNPNEHLS